MYVYAMDEATSLCTSPGDMKKATFASLESNGSSGEVPQASNTEFEEKARQLCCEFMGNNWKDADVNDIKVKMMSRRYGRTVLKCTLSSGSDLTIEPRHVLVRFISGRKFLVTLGEAADALIVYTLSEKYLAPKVFGVFSGGLIEEFLPSRRFEAADDYDNPSLTSSIARKLAQIHSLDVPVDKSPNLLFDGFARKAREALEKQVDFGAFSESERKKAQTLFAFDLKKEIDWFVNCSARFSSRVVFSHGDFFSGNFLLPTDYGHKMLHKVAIINMDLSSYCYRGLDFGTYFAERCFDYTIEEKPTLVEAADEDEKRLFVKEYLKEWKKLNPELFDPIVDNEETMYQEIDFYSLARYLLHLLVCFYYYPSVDQITSNEWDLALLRKDMYVKQQRHFLDPREPTKTISEVVESACCTIA